MGDALEHFIKDSFANSYGLDEADAMRAHSETFAYLGNQNNPPEAILRGGDAIEVKKIESSTSALALNSSYPKAKIYRDSTMLTTACKACDGGEWDEKDLIFAVGVVKNEEIKQLCFVYGEDYAASREIYERIRTQIKNGVLEIPDIEFAETNELGRVNHVDPLGITYLRLRGMWHIENPFRVFRYAYEFDATMGIILFYFNRRACWIWVENGCFKWKGLFFGFRGSITPEEIDDIGCAKKQLYISVRCPKNRMHYREGIFELSNTSANRKLLKSFCSAEIYPPELCDTCKTIKVGRLKTPNAYLATLLHLKELITHDHYEMLAGDYPIDAVQDENGCWVDDAIVHLVMCKKCGALIYCACDTYHGKGNLTIRKCFSKSRIQGYGCNQQ